MAKLVQTCTALAVTACAISAAVPASAGCARFTAGDIFVTYDPLSSEAAGQMVRPLSVSVEPQSVGSKASSSIQAQFVDFDSVSIPRIGIHGPVYTIYRNQDVVVTRNAPPMRAGQVFSQALDSKKSGGVSINGLQLIIDGGQDVPAGVYEQVLDAQYTCDTQPGANGPEVQPHLLRIVVDVPSKIVASLAGGSSTGTIDFEDFATPSRTTSVNVYSTGPYALKIESQHNGKMVLDRISAPSDNEQIGFSMTFQGQPVRPGVRQVFSRTGIGGAGLPLTVTTEATAEKRAGLYRDTITLTFTPLAIL